MYNKLEQFYTIREENHKKTIWNNLVSFMKHSNHSKDHGILWINTFSSNTHLHGNEIKLY